MASIPETWAFDKLVIKFSVWAAFFASLSADWNEWTDFFSHLFPIYAEKVICDY